MTKKEVFEILKVIKRNWEKFEVNQEKIDLWHKFLKNSDYDLILNNLETYIANNKFAPVISDIIKPQKIERDRYVPTTEETKAYLENEDKHRQNIANDPKIKEARERARADIQKMLGIKRG